MILVDANLLVYAYVDNQPHHAASYAWLVEKLNGTSPIGLPWASLLGFVRLVSNPRIFERPCSVAQAWHQAESWLDRPTVWTPGATERHREILASLLGAAGLRANLVPDAHLAALAIEHGLVLCSTDGDFARFPGLRWDNPLA